MTKHEHAEHTLKAPEEYGEIARCLDDFVSCVVKLGSQVIVDDDGRLSIDRLAAFARQIATHHHEGKRMILVSSGAVALGRPKLKFDSQQFLYQEQKQACAAVGQALMMNMYRDFFRHFDIEVAQVLVNPSDFSDRVRYNRLKELLYTLLDMRILPIINENDAIPDIQPAETHLAENRLNSFEDNDKLAALVASQLEADVLLVLSNVNGVYTANPFDDENAELLTFIPHLSELKEVDTTGKTAFGRGGMASKLEAADLASRSGTSVIIANGLTYRSITSILHFRGSDTAFPASFIQANPTEANRFKRWIAHASGYSGIIVINDGARRALLEQGASLLAVGVVDVLGDFNAGDVVSVHMEGTDEEVARGVIQYSLNEMKLVMGMHSKEIMDQFNRTVNDVEVIHRDKLVLAAGEIV